MSDEDHLVSRRSDRDTAFCRAANDDILDKVSLFAIGFVLVGLVFAVIGFLYPRDSSNDPDLSAVEREALEQENLRLADALDAIVITGMVMIAMGGLILSLLFTNSVLCQDCHTAQRHSQTRPHGHTSSDTALTSLPADTSGTQSPQAAEDGRSYGAVHND